MHHPVSVKRLSHVSTRTLNVILVNGVIPIIVFLYFVASLLGRNPPPPSPPPPPRYPHGNYKPLICPCRKLIPTTQLYSLQSTIKESPEYNYFITWSLCIYLPAFWLIAELVLLNLNQLSFFLPYSVEIPGVTYRYPFSVITAISIPLSPHNDNGCIIR